MDINVMLAEEFKLRKEQIDNTVNLIDDGKTIPFIARYRKEMTGSLDDQILREIYDRLNYLRNLTKRKEEITNSITEQGKMTEEIQRAIDKAVTLVEVEDIYRPINRREKQEALLQEQRDLNHSLKFFLIRMKTQFPKKKLKHSL